MQGGHPESLLLNGVVAQLVVEGISFPLRVEVDVEVLVDVGHVERLDHVSDPVQSIGRHKVAAHVHLEDVDGDALEQQDPEEDEEVCL